MWRKSPLIPVIIILGLALSGCQSPPVPELGSEMGSIDPQVETQLEELVADSGVPNLAAAIVVGDETVWARGFGQKPDLSTVYSAGSIDKSFMASAVMILVNEGALALEDDVNDYLPFSVRHPDYPETPVTVGMLLSHSAGLPHDMPGTRYTDNDGPMLRWLYRNKDGPFSDLTRSVFPMDRAAYLEEVFSPDSEYGTDYWLFEPGTAWGYSNSSYYLLLETVIQNVTGQRYQDYITQVIIQPLGLKNSSYEAADFPPGQIAPPYEDTEKQGYTPLPLTGAKASGKLRTTAPDLARYLRLHLNGGEVEGIRILDAASVETMHSRIVTLGGFDFPGMDFTGVGYGWTLWGDGLQGHGGATPGYFAQMIMKEGESGPYGVVIMMTYGCSQTACDEGWFSDYYIPFREILLEAAAAEADSRAGGE